LSSGEVIRTEKVRSKRGVLCRTGRLHASVGRPAAPAARLPRAAMA